jgi:hypothetical protein
MRCPLSDIEAAELRQMIDDLETILAMRVGGPDHDRTEYKQFLFEQFEACILAGSFALKSSTN